MFDSRQATRYIISCLGKALPPTMIEAVKTTLTRKGLAIEKITTLARKQISCLEIIISAQQIVSPELLTKNLLALHAVQGVDIVVQKESAYRLQKRLIVMDMDSTLTEIEVIDELAKEVGVGDQVAEITRRAMNGELSFPEALRERVALLEGLPLAALERVEHRMTLTPGAEKLIRVLKVLGFKIAVLSGGFDYFASRAKDKLALDYTYSNHLEMKDGVLTGKVVGNLVDGERKVALMEEIAQKEEIPLAQVIAVGDGANDLPMIKRAGLGIAFNAKPAVRAQAPCKLSHRDLSLILYFLGLTEEKIENLLQGPAPGKTR